MPIEFIDFSKTAKLTLNGKVEYVISISGSYSEGDSSTVIAANGKIETSGEYNVTIVYDNFSTGDYPNGGIIISGRFYAKNKDGSEIDLSPDLWNIFVSSGYVYSYESNGGEITPKDTAI